jgi:hypothetical protein
MKKYLILAVGLMILGIVVIILIRNDQSIMGGFIKLIGLSFMLASAFLIIVHMMGISMNKVK